MRTAGGRARQVARRAVSDGVGAATILVMLVRPTRILRRINIVRGGWAKPGDLNHNGSGDDVLDIGCGTGTFATLLKQLYPALEVIGLDQIRRHSHVRGGKQKEPECQFFNQGFADARKDEAYTWMQ